MGTMTGRGTGCTRFGQFVSYPSKMCQLTADHPSNNPTKALFSAIRFPTRNVERKWVHY